MEEITGLDRRALDRARMSRDRRFDGRFFIAVTSTGIYCRPICPAPSPKKANVRYYASAAAAAEAGFRPCLRCRPEAAPETPAWMGTSTVVRRALRLIDEGALDEGSVDQLAARVGIGARQLHRLFVEHVGASPITVAQTRRLHFAKRLLDETTLPITEIALAAGYASLRRFNDAFLHTYQRAPRDLRKLHKNGASAAPNEVALRLAYRQPYDWPGVSAHLAARAVPGVERVDERGYARTVAVGRGHAIISIAPIEGVDALELRARGAAPAALFQLSSVARRVFDVTSEPGRVAQVLGKDRALKHLLKRRPGLRIVGAWDPFECAVRAIIGDRVSLATARAVTARIVALAGERLPEGEGLTHAFPSAAALAKMRFDGVAMSAAKIAALQTLSRAVAEGGVDLAAPNELVIASLTALAGIGARIAQEVALYAFGDPDALPLDDTALRKAISPRGNVLAARAFEARAEAWRPWRGYAACYLRALAIQTDEGSSTRPSRR
jgi:AraC family transcriptional regulator of adaptative response / DNA-3-methyladenine glycosylase II